MAGRGADARLGQDDDGNRRPSVLRRRPRRHDGRRGVLTSQADAAAAQRDDHDGGRHARSRVLQRAGRHGGVHRSLLRERRGRRVPQLRHGAAVALAAANLRLGPLSDLRCGGGENRGADAVVEAAGLVVDQAVRRLADDGRVAVGDVRLQRRAVLPELHRGEGGAVGASGPLDSAWRERTPDAW